MSKAVLLTPSARTDLGFSNAAFRGALEALPAGWELQVIDNTSGTPEEQWVQELDDALAGGTDLLLAAGSEYEEQAQALLKSHQSLRLAIAPSGKSGERSLVLPLDEGALGGPLAAAAAAALTQSRKIAWIGGVESVDGEEGDNFKSRLEELQPEAQVELVWLGSFGDAEKARKATRKAIEWGADVLVADADVAVAQEAHAEGKHGINWVYDPNDSGFGFAIASAVVRFDIVWGLAFFWVTTGLRPSAEQLHASNFWRLVLYP